MVGRKTARDGGIEPILSFSLNKHLNPVSNLFDRARLMRFLRAHPERGWKRLLPPGLRSPDRPYDDFVAVILAERYLDGQRSTRIRSTRRMP